MEKYKKDELQKLILEEKQSYSSIGKIYGVSGAAIKKAAKKMGIKLPRRRKINKCENFSHPGKRKIKSKVDTKTDEEFMLIIGKCSSWKDLQQELGYSNRMSSNVKEVIDKRCAMLGMALKFEDDIKSLGEKTKGELFSKHKNWQSARSAIRRNACEVFFSENTEHKCYVCGYSNHIEVAHIKAVSEFDDATPIAEINSIDNLIALCPNHHWEYDNGILKL